MVKGRTTRAVLKGLSMRRVENHCCKRDLPPPEKVVGARSSNLVKTVFDSVVSVAGHMG